MSEVPGEAMSGHRGQAGIRYAFTPHDVDMTRLPGFDNAHGFRAGRRTTTVIAFGAWPA